MPRGGDALAQGALLALEPLALGFAGAKFEQKPLHQRGYGRIPLGGNHAELTAAILFSRREWGTQSAANLL
jgi:hypothetical protein